jgi:hypothetical protein
MTYQVPPHVHFRAVHDEVVVLDTRADAYLGLNASAAVAWQALAAGGSRSTAVDRVLEQFDVTAETAEGDIGQLVEELVSRGLLVPSGA